MNDDELRDAEAVLYSFFEKMVELEIEQEEYSQTGFSQKEGAIEKYTEVLAAHLTSGAWAFGNPGRFPPPYSNPKVLERKQVNANTCEFVIHFDRNAFNKGSQRFKVVRKKDGWRIEKCWDIRKDGSETKSYL